LVASTTFGAFCGALWIRPRILERPVGSRYILGEKLGISRRETSFERAFERESLRE
jgi:hypothetical protein